MSNFLEKTSQYLISILAGLLAAFESSINFFVPCLIVAVVDIIAAWHLCKRMSKKYPDKSDGKFKSEYLIRTVAKMVIILLAIVVANYVDNHIIKNTDIAVRFIVGLFLFYEIWSILENWSSENKNKIAKLLQRIMINKAERYLNIKISDIMENSNE
jgi:phage-related holin